MLSARAYSFRQQSRLAISLSWIGGYTNVVALLALGTLVSHVTGSATWFGESLALGNIRRAMLFGFLLVTFLLGAVLSAYLTETAKRRGWRSKFTLPMGLEALLLGLLALQLAVQGPPIPNSMALFRAVGLASIAMGLQNATITKISGAIVRTTHLTGIFTDLGLEGVQFLFWWGDELAKQRRERAGRLLKISRRHPTALRLLLLLSIAGSFGLGVIVGTFVYTYWTWLALLAPILFLLWIIYVDQRRPITDIRELDLLNDPELRLESMLAKLLPAEVVLYRASCFRAGTAHRAPNFQMWMDRVPKHCHIVILAVSPLIRFDANAVLDLGVGVRKLHADHKKLILSGITTGQFKALDALGVAKMLDVNNLCPDLEFAIARALAMVNENRYQTAEQI